MNYEEMSKKDKGGFKLFKPKDYCQGNTIYRQVVDAIFEAWNQMWCGYNGEQLYIPRPDILKPETTLGDIAMYACKKKDKYMFQYHILRNIIMRTKSGIGEWHSNFKFENDTTIYSIWKYIENEQYSKKIRNEESV